MKIASRQSLIRIITVLAIIVVVVFIGVKTRSMNPNAVAGEINDTIMLFNGKDLDNWQIVLKDSLAPADSTFRVKDGVIFSSGEPFGYARTKKSYSDYNLTVEWRWPMEAGNSGVFIHVNEDKVFPDCLECQLYHDHAGDFIAMGGTDFNERTDKSSKAVDKMHASAEKPAGEWNRYDIHVQGDSLTVYVNGVLQNVASGMNRTRGWIALQSEGAPVEFRNVMLIRKH